MDPLNLVFNFLAGIFICLSIPLLVSGLQALLFQWGNFRLPPLAAFVIGTLCLAAGLWCLAERPFRFDLNISSIVFWIAFLLTGFFLARRSPL